MNLKRFISAVATTLCVVSPSFASTVTFSGFPATTFTDGSFSTSLSGLYPDGFYYHDSSPSGSAAYNGYGQDGEYINFNNGVLLNSLTLESMWEFTLSSITASLYNSSDTLLASQSWIGGPAQTLTFNVADVSKISFNIGGGTDFYGDGRIVGWYIVRDITYNATPVPEPETYALFMAGLGLMGFIARRRKNGQA